MLPDSLQAKRILRGRPFLCWGASDTKPNMIDVSACLDVSFRDERAWSGQSVRPRCRACSNAAGCAPSDIGLPIFIVQKARAPPAIGSRGTGAGSASGMIGPAPSTRPRAGRTLQGRTGAPRRSQQAAGSGASRRHARDLAADGSDGAGESGVGLHQNSGGAGEP
jgi:hypothetical protein